MKQLFILCLSISVWAALASCGHEAKSAGFIINDEQSADTSGMTRRIDSVNNAEMITGYINKMIVDGGTEYVESDDGHNIIYTQGGKEYTGYSFFKATYSSCIMTNSVERMRKIARLLDEEAIAYKIRRLNDMWSFEYPILYFPPSKEIGI